MSKITIANPAVNVSCARGGYEMMMMMRMMMRIRMMMVQTIYVCIMTS